MDYFSRSRTAQTNPTTPGTPSAFPSITPGATALDGSSRLRPTPSMRIRRLPSSSSIRSSGSNAADSRKEGEGATGRRRSWSAPIRPRRRSSPSNALRRQQTNVGLASVAEEGGNATTSPPGATLEVPQSSQDRRASSAASSAAEWVLRRPRGNSTASRSALQDPNYERDVVDMLDVIDPEISTLTTLNNVQNSLYFPFDFGRYFNRQPTYNLSQRPTNVSRIPSSLSKVPTADERAELEMKPTTAETPSIFGVPLAHSHSISSTLSQSNFAVLPHGVVLEGWSDEDKAELNDYVRHLLHSRKEKFKRSMRGFGKYVRTPLGAFVTIYAFLITFWGTAWVLFIIGWLSVSGRQSYFINVCDEVLVALFAIMGDGLAPFRVIDTYRMINIVKYHSKTIRLRKERGLPDLEDRNDLPENTSDGVEVPPLKPEEEVLTEAERKKFDHHRAKFCKAHTYYKPHATLTHRAFSIRLLITIVILLDFHSIFQICLGATTWGISYHVRPAALTAVILACSISCNISGGIVITIGDKRTRKKEVVERMFRQSLTEEALHKLEKHKDLKATKQEAALANVIASKE